MVLQLGQGVDVSNRHSAVEVGGSSVVTENHKKAPVLARLAVVAALALAACNTSQDSEVNNSEELVEQVMSESPEDQNGDNIEEQAVDGPFGGQEELEQEERTLGEALLTLQEARSQYIELLGEVNSARENAEANMLGIGEVLEGVRAEKLALESETQDLRDELARSISELELVRNAPTRSSDLLRAEDNVALATSALRVNLENIDIYTINLEQMQVTYDDARQVYDRFSSRMEIVEGEIARIDHFLPQIEALIDQRGADVQYDVSLLSTN